MLIIENTSTCDYILEDNCDSFYAVNTVNFIVYNRCLFHRYSLLTTARYIFHNNSLTQDVISFDWVYIQLSLSV